MFQKFLRFSIFKTFFTKTLNVEFWFGYFIQLVHCDRLRLQFNVYISKSFHSGMSQIFPGYVKFEKYFEMFLRRIR